MPPGTAPPQKPTSTWQRSRAASRLAARCAAVVVGGTEFNGMSISVVTPPSAAARVAEAKPSHSVRPGSFTCTWVSTSPGSSTRSPRSRSWTASACARYGSTASIRPPATHTAAAAVPPGSTVRRDRSTRS